MSATNELLTFYHAKHTKRSFSCDDLGKFVTENVTKFTPKDFDIIFELLRDSVPMLDAIYIYNKIGEHLSSAVNSNSSDTR